MEEALYRVMPAKATFRLAVRKTACGKKIQDWYVFIAADESVGMVVCGEGFPVARTHYDDACSMDVMTLARSIVYFVEHAVVCETCGTLDLDHGAAATVSFA